MVLQVASDNESAIFFLFKRSNSERRRTKTPPRSNSMVDMIVLAYGIKMVSRKCSME